MNRNIYVFFVTLVLLGTSACQPGQVDQGVKKAEDFISTAESYAITPSGIPAYLPMQDLSFTSGENVNQGWLSTLGPDNEGWKRDEVLNSNFSISWLWYRYDQVLQDYVLIHEFRAEPGKCYSIVGDTLVVTISTGTEADRFSYKIEECPPFNIPN